MSAHKHKWQRRSTTLEDVGRGLEVRVLWVCSTCKGERISAKRIRPPASTAKAYTAAAVGPGVDVAPTDEAAEALAGLGFKQPEIGKLLQGTTGTLQDRIAAALQRNGAKS